MREEKVPCSDEINYQRYLVKARVDRSGSSTAAWARKVPNENHEHAQFSRNADYAIVSCRPKFDAIIRANSVNSVKMKKELKEKNDHLHYNIIY